LKHHPLHSAPGIFATDGKKVLRVFNVIEIVDVSNGDETQNDTSMPASLPSSKLVRFLFVMSHIAFNYLVYNKTNSIRKNQKVYTRKIESSQPITE